MKANESFSHEKATIYRGALENMILSFVPDLLDEKEAENVDAIESLLQDPKSKDLRMYYNASRNCEKSYYVIASHDGLKIFLEDDECKISLAVNEFLQKQGDMGFNAISDLCFTAKKDLPNYHYFRDTLLGENARFKIS